MGRKEEGEEQDGITMQRRKEVSNRGELSAWGGSIRKSEKLTSCEVEGYIFIFLMKKQKVKKILRYSGAIMTRGQ